MKNSSGTTEYLDMLSSGQPGSRTSFSAAGTSKSFHRLHMSMLMQTKLEKYGQKFKLHAKHKAGQ
ncbi:MAG: hypothetical protein Q7K57_61570 [Burkholderiaceae bacterium]|nr:hypothetical protein [Burkholderiaceae bacterium]